MPEMNNFVVNTSNTSYATTTTKSSLTTRVTLNMRKCKRRASDVGYQQQMENYKMNETTLSPQMVNVERHSICESPLHLQEIASDRKSSSIRSSSILSGIFSNKVIFH